MAQENYKDEIRDTETDDIKISVIVLAYNIDKYIGECLDSIISQTYKNLEIIVVDDGSKDNTSEIIDRYAEKDKRIVTIHKSNGGQSSARNAGLEVMTGDYVSFIDGDDTIHPDTYKRIVEELKRDGDIDVISFFVKFETLKEEYRNKDICKYYDSKDLLSDFIHARGMITYSVCDKVIKSTIFDNIRFYEGKYYEDGPVAFELLINTKKTAVLFREFYNYETNRTDSTTYTPSVKILDAYYIFEKLKKKYQGNEYICNCIDTTIITHLKHNFFEIAISKKITDGAKKDLLSKLCNIAKTKRNANIIANSLKEKLSLKLFCFFPEIFALVYMRKNKQ